MSKHTMNINSEDPRLLIAKFEINDRIFSCIVDTGATTSFIPENGNVMRYNRLEIEPTNLNVQLGNNDYTHVNKKTELTYRPYKSTQQLTKSTFYICDAMNYILGHDALIGLKQLKMFEFDLLIRKGRVVIYHQNREIGSEQQCPVDANASIRIDDRFDNLKLDTHLIRMIRYYKSVFTDIDDRPIIGRPMRITTVHSRPIASKQRHYNPTEALQMKEHIENLLKKRIIEPSNSGYSATSRIIPKKSGAGRLVVNYIPLNNVTIRDSHCIPHITDIFGIIQGNTYFSTMDCSQGFYQIEVDNRDRHKTGFSTPLGNYQFRRCPFGARNSCAYFQSEMNRIFREGLLTRCIIYVDDILVFGRTKEEHDANLDWVLNKCMEFNVKLKLEKCNFAKTKVEYLGFTISGSTIEPVPARNDSLIMETCPSSKTGLKSIIGKLNFYARFIPGFSKQLEPLRELLRSNKDFQWRPIHQLSLDNLLQSLSQAKPQLLQPTYNDKIIELLVLDDSIESTLLTTKEELICRAGKFLSTSETNYSLTEKYLLALVLAINKFKIMMHPNHIKIRLPTKELEKVITMKNRTDRVDALLLKLPIGFDEFKFEVRGEIPKVNKKKIISHIPEEIYYVDGACKHNGKPECIASWAVCAEFDIKLERCGLVEENPSNQTAEVRAAIEACEIAKSKSQKEITIVTDSKYLHSAATNFIDKWSSNNWLDHKNKPVINTKLFQRLIDAKDGLQIEWVHVRAHAETPGNIRVDNLARSVLNKETEVLCALSDSVSDNLQDDEETKQLKRKIIREKLENYVIKDDKIYYIDTKLDNMHRLYVSSSSRSHLMLLAHDDKIYGGHLGIKKTYRKLIKFWWPRMYQEVEDYVKSCDVCQRFKNPPGVPTGYLQSIPVSSILEHVHLDIMGPYRSTCRGHSYIITATDAFSKWAYAKPYQSVTSIDLIRFVEENILAVHGKPSVIITDRGRQFVSHQWNEFLTKYKLNHHMTTPYHPQANGIDERVNGTLSRILRNYVQEDQSDWDENLKWALFVYNTTVHDSTHYSPYQVIHGLDSRSPLKPNSKNGITQQQIDNIRGIIRDRAGGNNIKAQEKQTKYYNENHKESEFMIGQLVMVRRHAIPPEMSRKFVNKWDGPFIIIGFLSEQNYQRAVTCLDIGKQITRNVPFKDIKPYYNRTNDINQEEIPLLDTNTPTSEYIENPTSYSFLESEKTNQIPDLLLSHDQPTPSDSNGPRGNGLDLVNNEDSDTLFPFNSSPLKSPPKRVRYSEDVRCITYEPSDPTEDTRAQNENLKYRDLFQIDNHTKDPTYKAKVVDISHSDRRLRSNTIQDTRDAVDTSTSMEDVQNNSSNSDINFHDCRSNLDTQSIHQDSSNPIEPSINTIDEDTMVPTPNINESKGEALPDHSSIDQQASDCTDTTDESTWYLD